MYSLYIEVRFFSWAPPNCSCVWNLTTCRTWAIVWMLEPFASRPSPWAPHCRWRSAWLNEAASSFSEAAWFLTLCSPPLKHKTGKMIFFYIWLCRDDSRSASCEQMCCCSGSYSLTDQSHHHKLINQHEPFRAPGAPGLRGLGASGPPGRCLGCLVAVEIWSILSLQMYTGEEDQCAAASETFLWMFYHICDCAESSSGGAAEDPGWELLTSSWRSRLHLFQPAADSEHLIVMLVCLFTVLVMLSCSLSSNDLNFPGLYCRPAL